MVNKTDSDYRTISVRLPRQEFIDFDKLCNGTHSAKLRELINKEVKNIHKSNFLVGTNRIIYNKLNNSFDWFVQLDSGKGVKIIENLTDDFLKNLQQEIQEAIKIRNMWVHQTKESSVDVPKKLLEVKGDE